MHPGVIITSALALVIGLAIVAVLVSKNAQTPTVLSSAGSALAGVITAAVSPVTQGGSTGLSSSVGNYMSNPQGIGGILA
jgi:hypothetical protein